MGHGSEKIEKLVGFACLGITFVVLLLIILGLSLPWYTPGKTGDYGYSWHPFYAWYFGLEIYCKDGVHSWCCGAPNCSYTNSMALYVISWLLVLPALLLTLGLLGLLTPKAQDHLMHKIPAKVRPFALVGKAIIIAVILLFVIIDFSIFSPVALCNDIGVGKCSSGSVHSFIGSFGDTEWGPTWGWALLTTAGGLMVIDAVLLAVLLKLKRDHHHHHEETPIYH